MLDVARRAADRQILRDYGLYVLWNGPHILGHFEIPKDLLMRGYNSADGSGESNATEQHSKHNAFQNEGPTPILDPLRLRA